MNCSFYLATIIAAAAVFLGVLSLFFFLRKFKIKKKMDQCSAGTVKISVCPCPQNEISSVFFFLVPFPGALAQLSW